MSDQWTRHRHNYGWVCQCGYHGKRAVGRRVHERRGCTAYPKSRNPHPARQDSDTTEGVDQ